MRRPKGTGLRSLSNKIVLLLLVAAAVPALFTGGLAFIQFDKNLKRDVTESLRKSASTHGEEVQERLVRARNLIDAVAESGRSLSQSTSQRHPHLFAPFDAAGTYDSRGGYRQLHGESPLRVDSSHLNKAFLDAGKTQLVIANNAGMVQLLMVRQRDDGLLLVFRLRSGELWTPHHAATQNTEFCIGAASKTLYFCTDESTAPDVAWSASRPATLEWSSEGGERQFGAGWRLFLEHDFASPSLKIVAYRPRAHALQSRADFSRVFWPAFSFVLVLVAALTYRIAGRSLNPLGQLTQAARQLAHGNLASRVRIRTNDEFESLGDAFNTMASKLGRQIATLEAMSEIDRLILSNLRLEDVAENVLEYVRELTNVEAAAVIARFPQTPYEAQMFSIFGEDLTKETVAIPTEPGHKWCQPRQVSLHDVDDEAAPYKHRFRAYGLRYALLVPVVMDDELKGVLILGSATGIEMHKSGLKSCVDLAGRLAVALSSVEREEALYRKAHYDDLTGLPNRQLLTQRLRGALHHARSKQIVGAMLFLDLDRFKEINDVYGHSVGDTVLTQAAERIVNEVGPLDTVARLGGDEFVVIMPDVNQEQTAAKATRLLARLSDSFSAGGVEHFVAASIGIVMFPTDGDSVETLLKNADFAMYRAKDAGRGRYEFFSQELNAESHRKISLERDLRAAFDEDQLELHYQPQFEIRSGVLSGAEALLRWNHPGKGAVSPAEFVPLAEDTSLIIEMGRWAIRHACRDLRKILDLGLHPGPISINVSTRQLRDPHFEIDVLSPLRDYDVHPGFLQLEVTETTVAQNKENAVNVLNKLRSHGVRIAIDDFGTGYSSLSYLQQMPFDHIKIDMSFVQNIGADEHSDNICRTIIRMAHELGKEVIAEGVENAEQLKFLLKFECDYAQGHYHSEALSTDDFLAFVRKQDFHTQRRKALEVVTT